MPKPKSFQRPQKNLDRADRLEQGHGRACIELKKGPFKPDYAGKMNFYFYRAGRVLLRLRRITPAIGFRPTKGGAAFNLKSGGRP